MPSIGVLEHFQKVTDQPRRIKKSGGKSLVNQGRADWIIRNVLLKMRPVSEHPLKSPAIANNYIPWGLEPSIDARIGVIVQAPVLANQIRFRPIADQRSQSAY